MSDAGLFEGVDFLGSCGCYVATSSRLFGGFGLGLLCLLLLSEILLQAAVDEAITAPQPLQEYQRGGVVEELDKVPGQQSVTVKEP